MSADYEFCGYILEGDLKTDLYVRISAPQKASGDREYSCTVHAPRLLVKDERIHGVNAVQALKHSVLFLNLKLKGRILLDKEGNTLPGLPTYPS
jgi:hypothetical protein